MRPVTSLDDFRAARSRSIGVGGRGTVRARITLSGDRGTIRVLRPGGADNVVPLHQPRLSHCPPLCQANRPAGPTVCLLPDGSRRCAAAQLRARAS